MKISDFQDLLKELYLQNDLNRGVNSTFIWLIEEIGELATLLNSIDIDINTSAFPNYDAVFKIKERI